jgi:hypothetical protein
MWQGGIMSCELIFFKGIRGTHLQEFVWPAALCCTPPPMTQVGVAFGTDPHWSINIPYSKTKMVRFYYFTESKGCVCEMETDSPLQNNQDIENVFRILSKVQNVFETRRLKYLAGTHIATPVTIQPAIVAPTHHTIDMPVAVVMTAEPTPVAAPEPVPAPAVTVPADSDVEKQQQQQQPIDDGEMYNVPIDGDNRE